MSEALKTLQEKIEPHLMVRLALTLQGKFAIITL